MQVNYLPSYKNKLIEEFYFSHKEDADYILHLILEEYLESIFSNWD